MYTLFATAEPGPLLSFQAPADLNYMCLLSDIPQVSANIPCQPQYNVLQCGNDCWRGPRSSTVSHLPESAGFNSWHVLQARLPTPIQQPHSHHQHPHPQTRDRTTVRAHHVPTIRPSHHSHICTSPSTLCAYRPPNLFRTQEMPSLPVHPVGFPKPGHQA
jgi:hypothetical protein